MRGIFGFLMKNSKAVAFYALIIGAVKPTQDAVLLLFSAGVMIVNLTSSAISHVQSFYGTGQILVKTNIPSAMEKISGANTVDEKINVVRVVTSEGPQEAYVMEVVIRKPDKSDKLLLDRRFSGTLERYAPIFVSPAHISTDLTAGQIKDCYLTERCRPSVPANMKPWIRMLY